MKRPTSPGALRSIALAAFAIASSPPVSHAALITNPSFESGTSGWSESGGSGLFSTVSSLTGSYGTISTPDGSSFGLISNNGVALESVSQTFDITNSLLSVSYRFLTDEHNTGAAYNDSATIVLTIAGNPFTLASISRNALQAGGEGSLLGGSAFLDNTQSGFDIGQSIWQTATFDTSGFIGQAATLTFQVTNVGGNDPDIGVSQLAVDHVQQVPEPSVSVLASLVGLAVVRRRRR